MSLSPADIDAIAEAVVAKLQAAESRPVSTVAAEIYQVRLAGGDLAQHFRDKFAASKTKAGKAARG